MSGRLEKSNCEIHSSWLGTHRIREFRQLYFPYWFEIHLDQYVIDDKVLMAISEQKYCCRNGYHHEEWS